MIEPALAFLTAMLLGAQPYGTDSSRQRDERSVHFVGAFSNMEFTEEHAYGSRLELWTCGSEFMGLFMFSEGLAGDTPAGLLEKLQYDSTSKGLSFEARLTTGVRYRGPRKEDPTHDLFVFVGTLQDSSVDGMLKRFDKLEPTHPPVVEKVVLKKVSEDDLGKTLGIKTLHDWKAYTQTILKYRGPKW